jgi:hypothetical protein
MAILVYQLACTATGKSYVGISSRALDTRWLEHCARAMNGARPDSRLYNAMRKHGLDGWTRQVVATVDTEDEARAAETAFIRKLDTFANGYNANEGGNGSLIVSAQTRQRIGDGRRGKKVGPEGRARMSAACKARTAQPENFGDHTEKGDGNPRAKSYVIKGPTGRLFAATGIRAFCREHGLGPFRLRQTLDGTRSEHKGYVIISTLGDRDKNTAADNTRGA